MMTGDLFLLLLAALPVLLAAACLLPRSPQGVLRLCAAGTCCTAALMIALSASAFAGGALSAAGGWLRLDALSAFHTVVMAIVFSLSAMQAPGYFSDETDSGAFSQKTARRFGSLWFGSMAAMLTVLLSGNIGVMWVGIEATTLLTAFLICIHATPKSLEAMWKYLLMCSVGVALAFTGTLLIAASASHAPLSGAGTLLWTGLASAAGQLDPPLLKAGFIFLVVGYGTKAGLAPMHSWLPDAHSQSPAPVSAVFSGFLLNSALYCIFRVLPIVESATGHTGWGSGILVAAGLASLVLAAVFIVVQKDLKRLLAYSSLEHIGIITLGVGLGGTGIFAAMLHTLAHSIGKTTAFLSAGRLVKAFGSSEMKHIRGALAASPVWGGGLLVSLLALLGTAPFALFLSELMILRTAVGAGAYAIAGIFLAATIVIFIGALRVLIPMAWGPAGRTVQPLRATPGDRMLVLLPLLALLALGLLMPGFLRDALAAAAAVIAGGAS
jgi:hydrogenase-4 component F